MALPNMVTTMVKTKVAAADAVARSTFQKRQYTRLALRMSAEVHTEKSGVFTAATRDLSEGGVGIDLSQLLPEGELVTLGLFLVVDDVEEERVPPLWVKGRVVWSGELDSGGAVAGVRFEVITAQQIRWLRHLLGHLTAPPR
jgi:hypothetical protein